MLATENLHLTKYLEDSVEDTHRLLANLVEIPAPSHNEEKRAEFIKAWLEDLGAEGVYIDSAKNAVYPLLVGDGDDIVVFEAHTDTVFPDTTPFELKSDGTNFYAPGVGDDTCSLAIFLTVVRYIVKNNIRPKRSILFVANSCEEGLGNLKGTKQLMEDYAGKIKELYTFDGKYPNVCDTCVGSHRYEIECRTIGGHSFGAFGNPNAIHEISKLITSLYTIEIPKKPGTKTTYNVGTIEGGTSVNTIAQSAKMLYEYRSDDVDCLEYMKTAFEEKLAAARAEGKAEFDVKVVGIRPCGLDVDEQVFSAMKRLVESTIEKHTGSTAKYHSGSTDCNVPRSLGIPALCPGVYQGGGAHTREEYVNIASIRTGLKLAADMILHYFEF